MFRIVNETVWNFNEYQCREHFIVLNLSLSLTHTHTRTRARAASPAMMANASRLNNRPNPPLIFRSYASKSTHNTQLTEGVIPGNIRINPRYIRYMQTSRPSQGHYGRDGGRGGGVLAKAVNGLSMNTY